MTKKRAARGLLFIISGPSGSGKTTLARNIIASKALRGKLARSISFTTRPKRSGEKDRKDYFFISAGDFRRALKAGGVLEWTRYLGYYYGTPKDFVDKQLEEGKHVILCLDFKGACAVRRLYRHNSVTIFVMPPSLDALLHRMTGRCNETKKEEIRKRLKMAQRELVAVDKYDYCVVNKDLKKATDRLTKIILTEISRFKYRGEE